MWAEFGKRVLLTPLAPDDRVGLYIGGIIFTQQNNRPTSQEAPDTEKLIPWAEGNGLWSTVAGRVRDLAGVDVVTFFVQNPYTCDSAASIAVRIGRPVEQVRSVLDGLADAQLLIRTDLDDVTVYELTDEPQRRQTLQQYVAWLREGFHWARMVLDGAGDGSAPSQRPRTP